MSNTPIHTPINQKVNKKLPMIVDIALDDNGKQLYQVHESSKLVRKEMPKSTKFNSNTLLDEDEEEKTPIRKILGTISPSTLNQKKVGDDESTEDSNLTEPESATRHNSVTNMLDEKLPFEGADEYLNDLNYTDGSSYPKSNDIWSNDVEDAFEEVLSIIPKNGLNKIKISGRSCGRNELISDYILTKTGKYRTRKQVSSHIQVIKNLGQKQNIIKLINEGPVFETEAEQLENNKKFEEIFSKINIDKSLGFNKTSKRKLIDISSATIKKPKVETDKVDLHLDLENLYISLYDSMSSNPIIFTFQNNNEEIKNLKLKSDANISNRFPGLLDFKKLNIPILHNFVKLYLPNSLPFNYSIDEGLKTNMSLRSSVNGLVSIFTVIYLFGKEFFKTNEGNIKLNENFEFLTKFWKYFLKHEIMNKAGMENNNLKGITIKQIVYENNSFNVTDDSHDIKVPKLKIKYIFLWEFAKVNDVNEAVTTTSKLLLPDEANTIFSFNPGNVVPQVVNYNQPIQSQNPSSAYYGDMASSNIGSTGNTLLSNNNHLMTGTPTSVDQGFFQPVDIKPQTNIQKKFQSLQQQQHQQIQQPHSVPMVSHSRDPSFPDSILPELHNSIEPVAPTMGHSQAPQPEQTNMQIHPPLNNSGHLQSGNYLALPQGHPQHLQVPNVASQGHPQHAQGSQSIQQMNSVPLGGSQPSQFPSLSQPQNNIHPQMGALPQVGQFQHLDYMNQDYQFLYNDPSYMSQNPEY